MQYYYYFLFFSTHRNTNGNTFNVDKLESTKINEDRAPILFMTFLCSFYVIRFYVYERLYFSIFAIRSECAWIKFNLYVGWHFIRIRNARAHDFNSTEWAWMDQIRIWNVMEREKTISKGKKKNRRNIMQITWCVWHNTCLSDWDYNSNQKV